jgi:hypothetical protein
MTEAEILAMAAIIPKFPDGVYSTNVVAKNIKMHKIPNKIQVKLHEDITTMFSGLSQPEDLYCAKHTNGFENLCYGVSQFKPENGYKKGDDEEVLKANLTEKWDASGHPTNSTYVGIQLNLKN